MGAAIPVIIGTAPLAPLWHPPLWTGGSQILAIVLHEPIYQSSARHLCCSERHVAVL